MTTPMSDDNTSPVDPADFAQATAGAVLVGNQLADARKPLLPARAGSIAKVPSREGARTPGKKITMPMNITDAEIEVQSTYRTEGANDDIFRPMLLVDRGGPQSVPGLQCRIGRRSVTWIYSAEKMIGRKRRYTFRTLGAWPSMNVAEARQRAMVEGGRRAARGHSDQAPAEGTFAKAFAAYLVYLTDKAEDNGKLNIDRNGKKWSNTTRRVEGFGRLMLLPEFGGMTLVQLSNSRQLVHDWHRRMIRKHGVASANLAARCLGTIYERERKLSDLPDVSPILAVHWARENWKDNDNKGGLEARDFPA